MAHTSLIQVRIDDTLKKDAENLFDELGIDLSSAIRVFLKQAVMRREIPFPICTKDNFYRKENQIALKNSILELENGRTVTKTMDELKDYCE